MNTIDQLPEPVASALELLFQTDDPDMIDKGYNQLKTLADGGDMTAAACLGYASQFEHIHYDLEICKTYLQMSANANNPLGQYYLGTMLFLGEEPFGEDKILGKWMIYQAEKAGIQEATIFKDNCNRKLAPEEARKMVIKASLSLIWEKIKHPFGCG